MHRWSEFENSSDYRCNCHMGVCFIHGDGVDNPARETFLKHLTERLGITEHPTNSEDYGSPERNKARSILHAADYYVSQVLKQIEGAKKVSLDS